MGIENVIALLSGVALFLYGMNIMGEGLKKVAGSKLEIILYKLTSTPLKGVLLGTGVTAVIQSSSATSVMVVGFVNSGMMKVKQAIGIVMGAILGTSVTGWVLCLSELSGGSGWVTLLSSASLTGIVAVTGVILKVFCKKPVKNHLGDILMGFAVLMFGMTAMSDSVSSLRDGMDSLITKFQNPLFGILVGCLITCVLQSASATVGILQALTVTGKISFSVALPLIMGIAIGAAVPVLISAIGTNINGKRTAFIYLIIDVLGVVIVGGLFYGIGAFVDYPFMDRQMTAVSVAFINTLFRLITVVILTPFIGLLEKLVVGIFREAPDDEEDDDDTDRLEDRFIIHPALAIEQSRTAMSSMIRKARKNLSRAFNLLDNYTDDLYRKIQNKEYTIDRYEDKLGSYLVKINQQELSHGENIEISKLLHTISDVERIADHAVNISNVAAEINEKKLEFSGSASAELKKIRDAVDEIVDISFNAFNAENIDAAFTVEPLEEVIDRLCDEVKLRHINRVQSGNCTLNLGFVFNDLLSDFERIADHCSNIAVAMIELNVDSFDTHEYLNDLKRNKPAVFRENFERYSEKYALEPVGE